MSRPKPQAQSRNEQIITEKALAEMPDCQRAELAEILYRLDNTISVSMWDERGKALEIPTKATSRILALLQGTAHFRCVKQTPTDKGTHWDYQAAPSWTRKAQAA